MTIPLLDAFFYTLRAVALMAARCHISIECNYYTLHLSKLTYEPWAHIEEDSLAVNTVWVTEN